MFFKYRRARFFDNVVRLLEPYFQQKQPSKGVIRKRRFEHVQQIYRRTPMAKCDFNKVVMTCTIGVTDGKEML